MDDLVVQVILRLAGFEYRPGNALVGECSQQMPQRNTTRAFAGHGLTVYENRHHRSDREASDGRRNERQPFGALSPPMNRLDLALAQALHSIPNPIEIVVGHHHSTQHIYAHCLTATAPDTFVNIRSQRHIRQRRYAGWTQPLLSTNRPTESTRRVNKPISGSFARPANNAKGWIRPDPPLCNAELTRLQTLSN